MPQFSAGDQLYINSRPTKDRLFRWDAGDAGQQPEHQTWVRHEGQQPYVLRPVTDYSRLDVTSESITLEANGMRVRATHGRESSGGMHTGTVVDVSPLDPA